MDIAIDHFALLRLLQLASPALPVGAYSYSEGLETLIETHRIDSQLALEQWLKQELLYGAIRLEAALLKRAYEAALLAELSIINYWNHWLSTARETEELRSQSWQMGRSLLRLFRDLNPVGVNPMIEELLSSECNFAIAFGLVAAEWQIELQATLLGYLHSWAMNLINAGVKLIPLGQTVGQQTLMNLYPTLVAAVEEILNLDDDDLSSCGWGLALASMQHEVQYSRLFRS